jgi:hypothetical protein
MGKGDDDVTVGFEMYCKQVVTVCIEGYLSVLLVYYWSSERDTIE